MHRRPARNAFPGSPGFPDAPLSWAAASGPAEATLRRIQGLLADPAADPAGVLADIRATMAAAGYPTDPLSGINPALVADFFGGR